MPFFHSLLSMAVMQYWTFSWVLRLTPTVIFTVPMPTNSYSILRILSKGFWFLFPAFGLLDETFLAPTRIESSCSTANVERYLFAACSLVSIFVLLHEKSPFSHPASGFVKLFQNTSGAAPKRSPANPIPETGNDDD